MDKELHDAVEYANSSNKLEDNGLSSSEVKQVMEGIKQGEDNEKFVNSIVKTLIKEKDGVGVRNGKIR